MSFGLGYAFGLFEAQSRRNSESMIKSLNEIMDRRQGKLTEIEMAYARIQKLERELAQWKEFGMIKHNALNKAVALLRAHGIPTDQ
jgi:hypothetical protein